MRANFKFKKSERFRANQKIRGYFGLNGAGKTYAAVLDLLPQLVDGVKWKCSDPGHQHTKRGEFEGYRMVISNIKLNSPYYKPLRNFQQLLEEEHADFLIDEIQNVFGSSTFSDMPVQVKSWLHQIRRRQCTLAYTGITYARAMKELREVTRIVTFARGYFPVYAEGATWPSNLLFYYLVYDAQELEAMELSQTRKNNPKDFQWFSRFSKRAKIVEAMYSTFDSVDSFNSEIAPVGLCLTCGGSIRRHTCQGHEEPTP